MKTLIVLTTILQQCVEGNDYFTSPAAVQKLFKVEHQLAAAFTAYAAILEKRMEKVEAYLEDYKESVVTGMNRDNREISKFDDLEDLSTKVASHPLMTHRLIRRFVVQLQDLERDLGNQAEKQFLNAMEKVRKGIRFPSLGDVQGSIEGLIRVQDAYDLEYTEFTQGTFQGLETKSSLTARDCYEVGVYAMEARIHTRAIEWLEYAYKMAQGNDTTIEPTRVLNDLETAIVQHDQAQRENPHNIHAYTGPVRTVEHLLTRSSRLDKAADHRPHTLYQEQEDKHDLYNFAALCSGKTLQSSSATSSLKCFYQYSPGNPIFFEKVEVLHQNPDVLQVYDVLSESTINTIMELATPTIAYSKVQGGVWDESQSTSTTAWIQQRNHNFQTILRRIHGITGLEPTSPVAADALQVSSYGIGGHYNPRLDLLFENHIPGTEERSKGDRIATILFYLSDVAKGGGTAFPRLGILAQPIKGSWIFWYNLRSDGTPDPLSLHGGCPVLYGTKHVANKWIRANAQFRDRKCKRQIAI